MGSTFEATASSVATTSRVRRDRPAAERLLPDTYGVGDHGGSPSSDGYGVLSFDLAGCCGGTRSQHHRAGVHDRRQDRGICERPTRTLPHRGPLDGRIARPSVHPAQRGRPPSEITHDPGNPPSRYADGPRGTRSDRARTHLGQRLPDAARLALPETPATYTVARANPPHERLQPARHGVPLVVLHLRPRRARAAWKTGPYVASGTPGCATTLASIGSFEPN